MILLKSYINEVEITKSELHTPSKRQFSLLRRQENLT